MDWNQVAARIAADDNGKWDRKVPAQEMWIGEGGKLVARNGPTGPDELDLSENAIGQFCGKLDIPPGYFRRLPAEMKATVANFDLKRMGDKTFLLRGKAMHVRAFLSGGYVPFNNCDITDTVATLLDSGSVRIKAFTLEETNLYVKLVSEDLVDPCSGLKAGVMIGNSEVGMGSVSVEPFVFRKTCTNDLVVNDDRAFKHAHIHLTLNELTRRLAEAIGDSFLAAAQALDAFLKTRMDPIPDPLAVIRKIAEERKMSQKLADQIVATYVADPEPSRFGLINAFTGAAKTLAPLQRIEMERFAGGLLSAPLQ